MNNRTPSLSVVSPSTSIVKLHLATVAQFRQTMEENLRDIYGYIPQTNLKDFVNFLTLFLYSSNFCGSSLVGVLACSKREEIRSLLKTQRISLCWKTEEGRRSAKTS